MPRCSKWPPSSCLLQQPTYRQPWQTYSCCSSVYLLPHRFHLSIEWLIWSSFIVGPSPWPFYRLSFFSVSYWFSPSFDACDASLSRESFVFSPFTCPVTDDFVTRLQVRRHRSPFHHHLLVRCFYLSGHGHCKYFYHWFKLKINGLNVHFGWQFCKLVTKLLSDCLEGEHKMRKEEEWR